MTAVETAAAYVRVSTDDQTELSPDAQLREILKAARADGYVIPREFIFMEKKGISGRRAGNRPEFQRMIATAKQTPAPFSRLYLWKFSRFARNQDESTFYKGILRKKCGVDIISVSEPIAQGMFGRLIETIIEWFDEYYSYNLSGEVRRGMSEKAYQKGYQLSPCLGYKAVGGGRPYIIDEERYKIVEQIFRMYGTEMLDRTKISRSLNEQGFRTQRGSLFEPRAITRILNNRFYIGEVRWNGITFQGAHETRSSVTDLFDACQERLRLEYTPLKRRSVSTCRHWLSGLLKCSVCGASLSYSPGGRKSRTGTAAVFSCWRYAKGYHRESCSIAVHKAEKIVLKSMAQILETGGIVYEYVPSRPPQKESGHLTLLEEQLKKAIRREERVRAAYENGIDTLEEYRASRQRIREETDQLRQEIEDARSRQTLEKGASKEEVLSRVRTVCELLQDPDVSYELKGNALRCIVKEIVFDREKECFSFFYRV